MLILILDLMSYITVGLLTIPAWISFFVDSLGNLRGGFGE
ncbi:MAG: hypothetical protein AMXMBFR13_03660 [Phycisphaerae bacterium]